MPEDRAYARSPTPAGRPADLTARPADTHAGQALGEILTAVIGTGQQVTEIGSAARQLNAASQSVVDAMQSISSVVEENTAATEQMAAQTDQVAQAIESIAAVSDEQSAATEQVSASSEEMSAQVDEMSAQAEVDVHHSVPAQEPRTAVLSRRCRWPDRRVRSCARQIRRRCAGARPVEGSSAKSHRDRYRGDAPETAALDDRCAFGQFLYQGADAELRRSELYERVRSLHAAFHQVALETLRLALGNGQTQARTSLASGGQFIRASAKLTKALLDWQREYAAAGKSKVVTLRRAA